MIGAWARTVGITLTAAATVAAAGPPPAGPVAGVRIGRDGPKLDACGGLGHPRRLNPHGDNFLAVKAGPSLGSARTDKLGPGAQFFICERSGDGRWTGIVYEPGGSLDRCGVSSPVATPRRYAGPCRSGWVASAYVEQIAG